MEKGPDRISIHTERTFKISKQKRTVEVRVTITKSMRPNTFNRVRVLSQKRQQFKETPYISKLNTTLIQ